MLSPLCSLLPDFGRKADWRKRRKLKAFIPRVVVFMNDPLSAERKIDLDVFFIVLWSYGRKICLNMCHGFWLADSANVNQSKKWAADVS